MSDDIDYNLYPHPGILSGLTVEEIDDYSKFALLKIEHFLEELDVVSMFFISLNFLFVIYFNFAFF